MQRQAARAEDARAEDARARAAHQQLLQALRLTGEKLATEPRRFTVVNIVGAIDLDQVRRLEGLGLSRLDLEKSPEKIKDKPGKDKADKPKAPRDKSGDRDDN